MSITNIERGNWQHEPVLRRFEAAWRNGSRPQIEDYLPTDGEIEKSVLLELACTDLEYRLKAGQAARVEDYQHRYPQLAADPDALLNLIEVEYSVRQYSEPEFAPAEFSARFPSLSDRLPDWLSQSATIRGGPIATIRVQSSRLPTLPGYEVMDELGRGGMGIVYKARHIALNRVVALKMVLDVRETDAGAVARFRAEAEAVAQLQHPNIVQVYEVGECEGRPYCILEFVPGGSLAEALRGTPMPAKPAAELVETLARAVEAAHERGIVHRDLKPANILLGGRLSPAAGSTLNASGTGSRISRQAALPNPKIADFGLAKRVEDVSGQTQTGDVIGTPSYMAPEQAAGRIHAVGAPADVYALGAILYECLTGRPPFKAVTALETLRQVTSEEPVPPRRLQPNTPADLETICLKCLAKEPHRRYATAEAMADDLERFRRGEPIVARPVGSLERLWRWSKRNPRVAGLAAALLSVLVVGLAIVTGLWRLADARRVTAEEERVRAVDARRQTRAAFDDMISDETLEWLKTEQRLLPEQKRFLQRALNNYAEFAKESPTDEGGKRMLAQAERRIGAIFQIVGDYAEAEKAHLKAIAAFEKLAQENGGNELYRSELADCLNNLALLQGRQLRPESAKTHERSKEICEQLAAEHPQNPEYRRRAASSQYSLASHYQDLGQSAKAEAAHKIALEMRESLTKDHPSAQASAHVANSLNQLALLWAKLGKAADAESAHRRALLIQRELAAKYPDRPTFVVEMADSLNNLGVLLDDLNRYSEAEAALRESQEVRQKIVTDYPGVPEYRRKLAKGFTTLGVVLKNMGRSKDSLQAHERAQSLYELLIERQPDVPEYRHLLASSLHSQAVRHGHLGAPDKAEKSFLRALEIRTKLVDEHPEHAEFREQLAGTCNDLANFLTRIDKRPEAESYYRKAIEHIELLVNRHPDVPSYRRILSMNCNNLALSLNVRNEAAQAEPFCRRSVELCTKLVADYPKLPDFRLGLANSLEIQSSVLAKLQQQSEAEAVGKRALEIHEEIVKAKSGNPEHEARLASGYFKMAQLVQKRDAQAALDWFAKAAGLWGPLVAKDPRHTMNRQSLSETHEYRARLLARMGRHVDALADWDRALELADQTTQTLVRIGQAKSLAQVGERARALETVDALAKDPNVRAGPLYDFACIYSTLSAQAMNDPNQSERDADRAVELLNQAVAKGFKNVSRAKADRDLDPLRNRPDFQKFVAGLEAGAKSP